MRTFGFFTQQEIIIECTQQECIFFGIRTEQEQFVMPNFKIPLCKS